MGKSKKDPAHKKSGATAKKAKHAAAKTHIPRFESILGNVTPSGRSRIDRRSAWNSRWMPSQKATLIFGIVAAIWTAAAMVLSIFLALTSHPYRSAMAVGVGVLVLGILRAVWPGRPWFASRRRGLDATVCIAAGVAILIFAPWTAIGIVS